MKIQSLSVVVPTKGCVNKCKFCVSRMHADTHKNQMDENLPFYDLYEKDYIRRLEFARDNGCNTVMITGNGEPQQNRQFLSKFGTWNAKLQNPFRWIEMQTTGVLLDTNYLRFLRNHVGISTISLSLSSFVSDENALINGSAEQLKVELKQLCEDIKRYDFNLRLSINLTKAFDVYINKIEEMFLYAKDNFKPDQLTFRILYSTENFTEQSEWISGNKADSNLIEGIKFYIIKHGKPLEQLPFGATKYSIHGMGVLIDEDCMAKELSDSYKYLILRPNCKLYSKWDDEASLIF